jgi:tetratricopeptide (TPR) repeat protein
MRVGNYERAAAEFERAAQLDPAAALPPANLALALIALRRYDEAEPVARRAAAADPSQIQTRYALGMLAAVRNQCTPEAVAHLRQAADKYPRARLTVARVLECRGEVSQAAAELRQYLGLPNAEHRQTVQRWLNQLQSNAAQ